jgi:hypothetical protein
MINLAVLIIPLVAGVLLGYFLRERIQVNLGKVTFGVILVLIFSLGFSIGSNGELLNSLPRVGLASLVLSLLAILFSVVFVMVARKVVRLE